MPGPLLHTNATVLCAHAGQATPSSPNPRVTVSSEPTVLLPTPWIIAGCPGIPPQVPPCVTGQWSAGTTRVLSNGTPLLLATSFGIGLPPGTPLTVASVQTRVLAT